MTEPRGNLCRNLMATSIPTSTTVVVPGTHVMTALVGPRDRHLRRIEQQFPTVQISVRGNEVRITGDEPG